MEALSDPVAYERTKAASELAPHITLEELTEMLEGYQTRYWDKDHYVYTDHPPELRKLRELLVYWPDAIDEAFIDKLYNYEDPDEFPRYEFEWVAANALYKNAPSLERNTKVGKKVQELWYQDKYETIVDAIGEYVWKDLYDYLGSMVWVQEKIVNDEDIYIRDRAFIAAYWGLDLEPYKGVKDSWTWVWRLRDCLHEGEELPALFLPTHGELADEEPTPFGEMALADIIAILCNTDWLESNEKPLSEDHNQGVIWEWGGPAGNWLRGRSYKPINELIRSDTLRDDIEEASSQKPWDFPQFDDVHLEAILHHPLFEDFRSEDDFKDWWNEWVHEFPYTDPDPLLGVKP